MNRGIGLPQPSPSKIEASDSKDLVYPMMPAADPPGRPH
jgi:hypothetical protein